MSQVVVYSSDYCPYCMRAKALLDEEWLSRDADLAPLLPVVLARGVGQDWHKAGTFRHHLVGVARSLALWQQPKDVRLLGLLIVEQRLLLALLLFQLGFLRVDLFAGLFQLRDSFLPRLVQVAEIGLQALSALAFFAAKDELNTGVFTLAKRGV